MLTLIAEGYSDTAIAERLSYSLKTVEKRITCITAKLDLHDISRADANIRVLIVLAYLRSADTRAGR